MNRHDILVALAREKKLTNDRQIQVRCLGEASLQRRVQSWDVSDTVLGLFGVVRHPVKGDVRTISPEEVEQRVHLHLMQLGLEPCPVRWVSWRYAERAELDAEWKSHVVGPVAHSELPGRVAQILNQIGNDIWMPLISLVPEGVLPFGLSVDGEFLVAEAAERFSTDI